MLDGFKNSKLYPMVQRALRVLQFLSAITSLIVFSIRIRKLLKLTSQLSTANRAVEGIVAAAVAYTLGVMLLTFILKGAHGAVSNILRWFLVLMDILFVGAFIAVAVLTSPKNGRAGPCGDQTKLRNVLGQVQSNSDCKLPLGTFVTAIFSTVLHALTAAFQNIREKRHNRDVVEKDHSGLHGGRDSTTVPIAHNNRGSNAV